MKNQFPQIEVPCFEDYYGESHKDASPVQTPVVHNLKNIIEEPESFSTVIIPSYSSWFSFDDIHEIEVNALPNLLIDDVSFMHYKECRNSLVNMFRSQPGKKVTIVRARNEVNCDVVNLIKIHAFLEKWGLINYKVDELKEIHKAKRNINTTAPLIDTPKTTYFDKEKIFCSCGAVDKLFFTTKHDIFVCKKCLMKGNFDTRCTTDDFMPFNNIHAQNLWTKKEELLMLNAIDEMEDWDKIALAVGKTKEQCIMRFLNLDIKASSLEKHLALFDGNLINNMSNPLMSFIALICGSVHPKIASEAAKWALNNLKERDVVSGALIGMVATKAQEHKINEDIKKEKLLNQLVELQIKKLELKMNEFEELCNSVNKERNEYKIAREAYLNEYESLRNMYANKKK